MATLEQASSILDKLSAELTRRQPDVQELSLAYDGEFKLHFASEDFKEYFARRYEKFSDNWCGIVADAPHERLEPIGIRLPGEETGDADLWATWLENDADAYCDLAMLDAIIAKRAYALVWGTKDNEPRITWEHPSQCVVAYDPETRARTAGLKSWVDGGVEYATLYLPDEVWKFERTKGAQSETLVLPAGLTLDSGWSLRKSKQEGDPNPVPNPLGVVPLVEMANRPRLAGEPHSDIRGALSMQHSANLFWAQLFAASDEATLGQRVVIGAEMPKIPILNDAGDVIGEKPMDLRKFRRDNIAWLEDPTAKIAQWQPAKLEVFTNVIEIMVGHIAAQTRTPAHYLLIGGTIANVSGDAMKALETGLVKRTEEKTQHFGRAIRDVFELVALVQDDAKKAAAIRTGKVLWKDVENRSDAQRADALQKKGAIGYPLEYLLELDGLPPAEIQRVMAMKRAEATDPILSQIMKDAAGANQGAAGSANPNAVPGA